MNASTTLGSPVLGGVAIDALNGPLSGTHGYQAVWLVCAAAIGASIPLLHLTREPSSG